MKRERRKMILVIIGILFCAAGVFMIFFGVSGSKTKTEFDGIVRDLITEADHQEDVFQESDIAGLPEPVKRYFRYCGYIGEPKMSYIKIAYQNVDFLLDPKRSALNIDYTQYNFVNGANRTAYIDSSMYGIPFEGLDCFVGGSGSMKGVLAKLFTLFDQSGGDMDKSGLVTFLSECLFIPNAALQEYIEWEAIDDFHAKATMTDYGISVSGIFTFDENGEMLSFETEDRSAVATDGSSKRVKWSVVCDEYREENGMKRPTVFQAIWHYDDGDLVYFDGKGTIAAYS